MSVRVLVGDVRAQLATLADESVHCVVTSPPYYGLRDYGTARWEGGDADCPHEPSQEWIDHNFNSNSAFGKGAGTQSAAAKTRWYLPDGSCRDCGAKRIDGQIGLEATPEEHIAVMVDVFREVRRVLRRDGVCWLNYGDAYAAQKTGSGERAVGNGGQHREKKAKSTLGHGCKPKDLMMMPARVALALQADGWWVRSQIPWLKRSAMPESATDRPATAIEYVFLLTRNARYFFDMEAVRADKSESTLRDQRGNDNGSRRERNYPGAPSNGGTNLGGTNKNGRNFRNSDLFYQSLDAPHGLITGEDGPPFAEASGGRPLALDVNPAGFAEAHFATFPPKLIEPLIKAGTSEKGCCARCAAPFVRDADKEYDGSTRRAENEKYNGLDAGLGTHPGMGRAVVSRKTLGWSPSCACGAEPAYPCTVLDPFGGSGTTGLVADRLGRDCILIELNPGYADMARKRIEGDAGLFASVAAE